MPTLATRNVVNLDALLPRANLDAPPIGAGADIHFKIRDLEEGLIYSWLRKPDFQRETSDWDPEDIARLIETFANGDIIPSIILWQSGQLIYVIDGAHRLSALIAWVRDDYGAGAISLRHYGGLIPQAQRDKHTETRNLVQDKVGLYKEHISPEDFPQADPQKAAQISARASKFYLRDINLQWIKDATALQAKNAFFRINQRGVEISSIETRILRANNSAVAIGARAISRAGTGHDYWKRFTAERQIQITKMGAAISTLLFQPALKVPIKTTDIPIAGFGYGSHVLPFVFDLVIVANGLPLPDSTRKVREDVPELTDDPDGEETIKFLTRAETLIKLVCSTDDGSLGLHPAIYFYTGRGDFSAPTFFNIAAWLLDLERHKKLGTFSAVRGKFEQLILDHPVIIKPPLHRLGTGTRNRPRMLSLFNALLDALVTGKDVAKVWLTVTSQTEYSFLLSDDQEQKQQPSRGTPGKAFSRGAKSAGYLRQALPSIVRCAICGGAMHCNSMTGDHILEKSKGGSSADENERPVHPKCNSARPEIEKIQREVENA